MEITAVLLSIPDLVLEELDLSDNLVTDFGCKHIAAILINTKIKRINLANNIMLDHEGLKEIS